jgi:acid phosphatase type 7
MKQGGKAYRIAAPVVVLCLLAAGGAGLWLLHVLSNPPGTAAPASARRSRRVAAAQASAGLVLGPYVTQAGDRSARVLWVGKAGAAAACEVLAEPNDPAAQIEMKVLPLNDVEGVALHEAVLAGLPADRAVRYRVTCGADQVAGSFRTFPPPGATAEFRFFVYGDSRSNPDSHKAVIQAMAAEPSAAFVVHTGDFVSGGDDWGAWQEDFFDPAATLLRRTTFWPVRGNHEGGGMYFRQLFDQPPGRVGYSFDCGNLHFAIVDQYSLPFAWPSDPNRMATIAEWLRKDLSGSKAEWKLVAYHEPTYNVGGHGSSWGRDDVLPVLETCGVDMVLAGHSHLYERFRPIGPKGGKPVIHVVTGGGGADLYSPRESKLLEASESCLHYCSFRVKDNELEMWARTPDGREIDHLKLVKTAGAYQKEIMDRALSDEEAEKE